MKVRWQWHNAGLLAAMVLTAGALAYGLCGVPAEAVQGDVQRIMYLHVPAAIVSYLAYAVVFVCGVLYLWRRERWWDVLGLASAEIGVVFTTIVLVSGSLWMKAVQGAWWTWDARLTTTLILWFLYVGYLMVRGWTPGEKGARIAAVVGIVGFLDVPIVHMSVRWFRTLHPGPTLDRPGGPALPPSMLSALLLAFFAFVVLYLALLALRVQVELLREQWEVALEEEEEVGAGSRPAISVGMEGHGEP